MIGYLGEFIIFMQTKKQSTDDNSFSSQHKVDSRWVTADEVETPQNYINTIKKSIKMDFCSLQDLESH